jgi:Ca-activated chloride channel family protein
MHVIRLLRVSRRVWVSWVVAVVVCTGCSGFSDVAMGPGGGFGATVGGVKDLRFARDEVAAGRLPPAAAILVEGAFAEHDLPLPAAACAQTLCLNAAAGVAPTLDDVPAGWAQIGLSSNIDPPSFVREPLNAILVVDVSGSMAWGGDPTTPGGVARTILQRLATLLDERDVVAIVAYGTTVDTVLRPTAGGDPAIVRAIAGLRENGSTNMEGGVMAGYAIADTLVGNGRATRLFLFTDENPNVGATSASAFETMVAQGGAADEGLTVFGLGAYLNPANLAAMAHLRLANAFTARTAAEVASVFEESWPWMASPIATDLRIKVTAPALTIAQTYGMPQGTNPHEVELSVGTVFLSKNRGAMLLRFALPEALEASREVSLALSYSDAHGLPVSDALPVTIPLATDGDRAFDAPSVELAVSLAVLFSGLHDAVLLGETGDATGAAALGARVLARAEADAALLGLAEFNTELEFARALVALL